MSLISDMRVHYDRSPLEESSVDPDGMKQFHTWFEEASNADILEPNAMTLSTINAEGFPSSRIVLLKGLEPEAFIFYTNYESDKGQQISKNPNISLLFLWKALHRQVRIQGVATKMTKEESESYFHTRPKGNQIGAWVSPQSRIIESKQFLADRKAALIEQYKDADQLPLPDFWGGYRVIPSVIEYWQGQPNRLHDRLRYTRTDEGWKIDRIAP